MAHFPPQTDGDLVRDGGCLLFIATKLGIAAVSANKHMELLRSIGCVEATPIGRWTFYRRNGVAIAATIAATIAAVSGDSSSCSTGTAPATDCSTTSRRTGPRW